LTLLAVATSVYALHFVGNESWKDNRCNYIVSVKDTCCSQRRMEQYPLSFQKAEAQAF